MVVMQSTVHRNLQSQFIGEPNQHDMDEAGTDNHNEIIVILG